MYCNKTVLHSVQCRLRSRTALLYLKKQPARSLWNSAQFRLSVGGLEAQGYAAQPTRFQVILTSALTSCVTGSNIACETSKALVLMESRFVLWCISTFCTRSVGFSILNSSQLKRQ